MIDISKALTVQGHMLEEELQWLAEQATQHSLIVEMGSYLGRSTCAFAANTLGTVIAIDSFNSLGPGSKHDILPQYLKNTDAYHNLCTIICEHDAIPVEIRPDMVFIDGSHDYESVLRDIRYWKPRVVPGGLICGHDYQSEFPGVMQAVTDIFPEYGVLTSGSIWWEK